MKEYYYYFRDAENKPRVTVCLLVSPNEIRRGVAICSLQDNPCKKTGRTLARKRALSYMPDKIAFPLKRQKGIMSASHTGEGIMFWHKGYRDPSLIALEQRIINPTP